MAALETAGLGVGEAGVASDKLKLLVLDKAVSNCLTDLTMSLSLPNVDTTRILGALGVSSVDAVVALRSRDRSDRRTLLLMLLIMARGYPAFLKQTPISSKRCFKRSWSLMILRRRRHWEKTIPLNMWLGCELWKLR